MGRKRESEGTPVRILNKSFLQLVVKMLIACDSELRLQSSTQSSYFLNTGMKGEIRFRSLAFNGRSVPCTVGRRWLVSSSNSSRYCCATEILEFVLQTWDRL